MFDEVAQFIGYAVVACVIWFGGLALLGFLSEKSGGKAFVILFIVLPLILGLIAGLRALFG